MQFSEPSISSSRSSPYIVIRTYSPALSPYVFLLKWDSLSLPSLYLKSIRNTAVFSSWKSDVRLKTTEKDSNVKGTTEIRMYGATRCA